MRTIRTKVYKFDELTPEAQNKAVSNLSDINVSHDWWQFTYEDAERIGLKITSFDLDRNRHARGKFIEDALFTANAILKEHGEDCETYKTAKLFLDNWNNVVATHSDGINTDRVTEDKSEEFDDIADQLEEDFLKSILEDYSIILQNESEYLQSKESIIETIQANEYEFYADGSLY
jgi:hypothetical protein